MATPVDGPRDATGFGSSASWAELPTEDQQILSVLDPSEAQPWLCAKIQHYERYLRALCAAYNNASLIHRRLPPELLMEIFGHVRPKSCQGVHLLHGPSKASRAARTARSTSSALPAAIVPSN